MHIFCYDCLHKWLSDKKNTSPLCQTGADERPIRDCAFEEELEVAIVGRRVAQVEKGRVTGTTYNWAGFNFLSA
jgi:hypothetical protein